jgi:hypothetical protein
MAFEVGGRIFGEFPIGNAADTAGSFEPFVSKPAGGSTVSGIGDHKGFVAMGRNPGLVPHDLDCFDSVQQPPTRWPEFDLLDQSKDLDSLSVVAPDRLFDCLLIGQNANIPICSKSPSASVINSSSQAIHRDEILEISTDCRRALF